MSLLSFLEDIDNIQYQPLKNFWARRHDIPESPGVYILLAPAGSEYFRYPSGRSPIFYIGRSKNLRYRLQEHFKYTLQAMKDRQLNLYYPRYEYAASLGGGRYTFIKTWKGLTAQSLEEMVLTCFAKRYHSWPVANSAGTWYRIDKLL